jgi:hypothetical protein
MNQTFPEAYRLHPGMNVFIARIPPRIWWIAIAALSAQRAKKTASEYFHKHGVEVSVQEIEIHHLHGGLIDEKGKPIALPTETPTTSIEDPKTPA